MYLNITYIISRFSCVFVSSLIGTIAGSIYANEIPEAADLSPLLKVDVDRLQLPDGDTFEIWEDLTDYSRSYHVNQQHPEASDENPGTEERPWLTISKAAETLNPGEEVIIHQGIYREWVSPARGGFDASSMIRYRAAPGDRPIIDATETWDGPFEKYSEWTRATGSRYDGILTGRLPLERFEVGYNPFSIRRLGITGWYPFFHRSPEEYWRVLEIRGIMRYNGEVIPRHGGWSLPREDAFYSITDDGRRLIFRLPDSTTQPEPGSITVTARRQCFAPETYGLGYISVQGLHLRGGSGGIPWPQIGLLSTRGGHHWIINDNLVEQGTGVGMDIGRVGPRYYKGGYDETQVGGHIVTRNTIRDMGVAGLCGTGGLKDILVAGNTITKIGHSNVEYAYESAAIKLHGIRGSIVAYNHIHDIEHAAGIWLDYDCGNTRVTGNQIHTLMSLLGGIYIEANRDPIWVDGNLIYDIEDVPGNEPPKDDFYGGNGISVDITDRCVVAHNTLFRIDGNAGIATHLAQKERTIMGNATSSGRDNVIINNLIIDDDLAVYLERPALTKVDGNVYVTSRPTPPVSVEEYDRAALPIWQDWQEVYGKDASGFSAKMKWEDGDTLKWKSENLQEVPDKWSAWGGYPNPGTLSKESWISLKSTGLDFPESRSDE